MGSPYAVNLLKQVNKKKHFTQNKMRSGLHSDINNQLDAAITIY